MKHYKYINGEKIPMTDEEVTSYEQFCRESQENAVISEDEIISDDEAFRELIRVMEGE